MNRSVAGRIGAHVGWSRTADRVARLGPARRNSPVGIEWHLARLGPELDGAAPAERMAAAESARKAYYARLAAKSADARRRASAGGR